MAEPDAAEALQQRLVATSDLAQVTVIRLEVVSLAESRDRKAVAVVQYGIEPPRWRGLGNGRDVGLLRGRGGSLAEAAAG